jgi:hypothetical protein
MERIFRTDRFAFSKADLTASSQPFSELANTSITFTIAIIQDLFGEDRAHGQRRLYGCAHAMRRAGLPIRVVSDNRTPAVSYQGIRKIATKSAIMKIQATV